MEKFQLPGNTEIGYIHLKVMNLESELSFYENKLGFKIIEQIQNKILLSSAREKPVQIILSEESNIVQRKSKTSGLYHLAILLPDRKGLAQMFKHLYEQNFHFRGFSDHGVSEALYLSDPENNGIEIYCDKPESEWQRVNNEIMMVTEALNLNNLLKELNGKFVWNGLPEDSKIGHIHLQVSDLNKSKYFYVDLLGFDITQSSYPGALFISAGGYHHHIGLNVWAGQGISPSVQNSSGLKSFSIKLNDISILSRLEARLKNANAVTDRKTETKLVTLDPDNIQIDFEAD